MIDYMKPLNEASNYSRNSLQTKINNMGSISQEKRNLIIVSNRLPLSVKRLDGEFKSSLSSGGLVTSLSGLTKSTEFSWFGWPGIEVKDTKDREAVAASLAEHKAVPIFLDADLAHEHYNAFSSTLPSSSAFSQILTRRLHPLAQPPLPIRGSLRRPPMASIQTSKRMFRRRSGRGSHKRVFNLDPRLPSDVVAEIPTRTTPQTRQGMRDWILAAYAVSGGGFLADVACSKGFDRRGFVE